MIKKIFFIGFIFCVSELFSQNKLTPEILWKLGRISEIKLSPDASTLLFGITYYDLKENKGNRDLYVMPISGGTPSKITDTPSSEYNALWTPDGKKIGFLYPDDEGNIQIWEMNPDGSDKKKISSFGNGINSFQYSPKGNYILFTKDVKLEKDVHDLYPDLPKTNAMVFDDLMYRHWNDWKDFSFSHVFYAPYKEGIIGRHTDILGTEPYDSPLSPYFDSEEIAWSPDESTIAYTCKKLSGKDFAVSTNSDIYLYDIKNGKTTNVSGDNKGYDKNPVFSPDGQYLAWQSMKTPGFESDKSRFALADLKNRKLEYITDNFDQSIQSLTWSDDSKKVYFTSCTHATYQIYSMDISSRTIAQITQGKHDFTELAIGKGVIVATKMSIIKPIEAYRIEEKTGKETQLTFVNREIMDNLSLCSVEEKWVTTSDNKKMLVWYVLPPNFDKNKKYPALLYCQGGPQSAVSQFFSYRWNLHLMAANDYIVVAPNRRGLPGFGQEWNDQISKDYGGQCMQDYLSAIDYAAKESFIDASRLGAVGASFGGYSVYWLAGNHNKRFKAFIAHCGMFNLESWYATTEELFFANNDIEGPYWKNYKSYSFSPHKFVDKWDTPIMVIHGGKDFRIPYTEGMQAFNIARIQDIPARFLYFPEETHFVLKPQNSVLWQREFFGWLDKWLKK